MNVIACETCGNPVQNTVFNFPTHHQVDDHDFQLNLPNSKVDVSAINMIVEENVNSEGIKNTAHDDIEENKQRNKRKTSLTHSGKGNKDAKTNTKKVDNNQNFVTNNKNRKKKRSKPKKKYIESLNKNKQENCDTLDCVKNSNDDVPFKVKDVKTYKTWQKQMKEKRKNSKNNIVLSKTNISIKTVLFDNIIHFDQTIIRFFKVLFALSLIIFWSLFLM